MSSLIEELQRDALNWKIPVTHLLQKCRVVAAKLDVRDLAEWVHLELDGYSGHEVPEYRKLGGIPQVHNPYHGYQPLVCADVEMHQLISQMPFGHPISEIEHMVSQDKDGLHFTYPPAVADSLRRGMHLPLQPSFFVSSAQLTRIVEAVRGEILEWSLRLEAAGVIGIGMSFSNEEKRKARSITYNIGGSYIEGNVEHSQLGTTGSKQMNIASTIPSQALKEIIEKLRKCNGDLKLSPDHRREFAAELETLSAQTASPNPKQSIVRESLVSPRAILENAAGSTLASGLIFEIGKLLG
jgi:hypothetical protein